MTNKSSFSSARFISMLLIGLGTIAIGFMFMLLFTGNVLDGRSSEFSTIPMQVEFTSPDLVLEDLEGREVRLSDYLGQVLLVNLWATWCPPCREEMPTLQNFYERYRDQGFVLIAINQEEERAIVASFAREFRLTFPVWLDLQIQAQRKFNTMNLPSSYVIDRIGRVRLMWIGGISRRNLEKYVPPIIKEEIAWMSH